MRRKAANRDRRDGRAVLVIVFGREAGHEFEELADVAVHHIAQGIGSDHVFDVGRKTLLINRNGLTIGFTRGRDGERIQFHHAAVAVTHGAGEIEISHGGLASSEVERGRLGIEAREKNVQHHLAGGHLRQAICAGLVGEHLEAGAADGDAGVVEKLAGDDVLHAAGNGGRSLQASCGIVGRMRRVPRSESEGEETADDGKEGFTFHGRRRFFEKRMRIGTGFAEVGDRGRWARDHEGAGPGVFDDDEAGVGDQALEGIAGREPAVDWVCLHPGHLLGRKHDFALRLGSENLEGIGGFARRNGEPARHGFGGVRGKAQQSQQRAKRDEVHKGESRKRSRWSRR